MRSYLSTIVDWKYVALISGDLSVNLHVDRFHSVTLSSECRPGGSHCCVTFVCSPIFEAQTIEVAVLTVGVPPRSCKYKKTLKNWGCSNLRAIHKHKNMCPPISCERCNGIKS